MDENGFHYTAQSGREHRGQGGVGWGACEWSEMGITFMKLKITEMAAEM